MTTTLRNIDSLDIDFVCKAIENSLRIKYNNDELSKISNLGELCDLTISKIEGENLETCTNQEAFYKLRNAFSEILNISKDIIKPKVEIATILPRRKRIENLKKIEKRIGFKLNLLRPPGWLVGTLISILIVGIIFLFVKNVIGIILIIFSLLGLEACKDYGKELKVKTFGQLVENAVLTNYSKLRSRKNTVNKNEIEKIVIGMFTDLLNLPKNELTRETKF
ncbi:hypothetical protein PG593_04590 [Riemerella anatipestifer]|nr:hypothetical protein [Riemerella anatipestifer]